jgi:hypothetical protein
LLYLSGAEIVRARDKLADAWVNARALTVDVRDLAAVAEANDRRTARMGLTDTAIVVAGIGDQSSVVSGDLLRWHAVIDWTLAGQLRKPR